MLTDFTAVADLSGKARLIGLQHTDTVWCCFEMVHGCDGQRNV